MKLRVRPENQVEWHGGMRVATQQLRGFRFECFDDGLVQQTSTFPNRENSIAHPAWAQMIWL